MYKPEMKRVLREERGRRGHKVKKDGRTKDSGEEECDMGRRYKEDASIDEPVSNAVEGVEAESCLLYTSSTKEI